MPNRNAPVVAGSGAAPTLLTLGALCLANAPITRPKPLLLLAYLAHEGPIDRERLARLFFSTSHDPRDALTTTLRRLHGLVAPASTSDARLQTTVTTDALAFQHHALASDPHTALHGYRGPFLQGAPVDCGAELEEWIVSTRERLACVARDLHLALARGELRRRRTAIAWNHAKSAVGLTEDFALAPHHTAAVLREVDEAGLPVPEGWWIVVAGLGAEVGWRSVAASGAESASQRDAASERQTASERDTPSGHATPSEPATPREHRARGATHRTTRLGDRSPRADRHRQPRRPTSRP